MTIDTAKLTRLGYDTTTPVKTMAALLAYVGKRPQAATMALAAPMAQIQMTSKQLAHFVGQACHESGFWRYLVEIWGPTATQKGYEGRKDLGNNQPGDGYKFRGRGLFETTGRWNYSVLGKAIGLPLDTNPELLEQPDAAVKSAIYFWNQHGLSAIADAHDIPTACELITKRVNGGSTGLDDRLMLTQRAFGAMV